jgi:peptidoglycan biosynthesis protein MviN/MurJ (putative lipid II flippase)
VTAAFNVGANLALVPVLGINGAALVTVLSEVVLLVPFMAWIGGALSGAGGGPDIGLGWKPLAAGAVTGAVMYGAWAAFEGWNRDPGSLGVYVGVGVLLAAVYAGLLAALRPFTREELESLSRVWRR